MKGKKTGGRKPGSQNKVTLLAKSMIEKWLDMHNTVPKGEAMPILMKDFLEMEPKDRVKVTTEFIKAITPKNINIDDSEIRLTIEDKLIALADDEDE